MYCRSLFVGVGGAVLACTAMAHDPCAPRSGSSGATLDPRAWIEIGSLRVCGIPRNDDDAAQTADVLVWEVGEAAWSRNGAFLQPGAVIVARLQEGVWREVRQLRSPQPAAYGGFGTQLASNGRWLAVLSKRPQSVWVFDLSTLEATGQEIEAARGFAQSVTMLGERIVVGGPGEARIFVPDGTWKLAERVAAPPGATDAFRGQIIAEDDVLVSSTSGLNDGDGGAHPGRVDVYRHHSGVGWRWESRLAPTPDAGAFGHDCCVAIDRGHVLVMTGGQRWRFAREAGAWRTVSGGTP